MKRSAHIMQLINYIVHVRVFRYTRCRQDADEFEEDGNLFWRRLCRVIRARGVGNDCSFPIFRLEITAS